MLLAASPPFPMDLAFDWKWGRISDPPHDESLEEGPISDGYGLFLGLGTKLGPARIDAVDLGPNSDRFGLFLGLGTVARQLVQRLS